MRSEVVPTYALGRLHARVLSNEERQPMANAAHIFGSIVNVIVTFAHSILSMPPIVN
jgi:hypothetical protein